MSWSREVKEELCAAKLRCKNCERALLQGLLRYSRGIGPEDLAVSTENRAVADLFTKELSEQMGTVVSLSIPSLRDRSRRPLYFITLPGAGDAARVWAAFFGNPQRQLARDCCRLAFLRGAFLACGTMSNPEKEYHLEFDPPTEEGGEELRDMLAGFGLNFHASVRGGRPIVYIKESEQLEDILARLGAVRASLELMNLKMEKELRNQVNRATNCETANISKTVNASLNQIKKIALLKEKNGLASLPPPLREAAELRLGHPDASLRELCELTGGRLSRSGLNHRLQKLCELAGRLGENG